MSVVVVREAVEADARYIGAFIRSAWKEAGPDGPGFAGATDSTIAAIGNARAIRDRIRSAGRRLFIADCRARVVGFAATRVIDSVTVELAGIIVGRGAAGMGIGTRLVGLSADMARADGMSRMFVRTETTNERAIAFYRHVGFEPVRTRIEPVEATEVEVIELWMSL